MDKTKILAVANQKGGVGKSFTCLQTAFYLKTKLRKKILFIDFDAQGNSSSRLIGQGIEGEIGTHVSELFNRKLKKVEVTKTAWGIDLLYTPKNDPKLFDIESIPLEEALYPRDHLKDILSQYDYVIIDCPPSLGRKLLAALSMATHVLCPVKLSGFAVDGVEGLLTTVIGVQKSYNPPLKISGILINDMDKSVSQSKALDTLKKAVPGLVLKNIIKHRPPIDTATSDGVPVWDISYGHVAAKEVVLAIKEILKRIK
ncbi:Sporulation initiation inhibitor protein Soj [invertebrate metagenome]|uniref:Sporulation initiation inhibitor protein Soj n=1 Tax=invertebrate metagenome TaxID=1711999 RepID=A0A2H9T514_9ZZZZ